MPPARKSTAEASPPRRSSYNLKLDDAQLAKLEAWCDDHGWKFATVEYARFAFRNDQVKVNLVAYNSGKLVVQGKGTEDFVRDVIEAEITGDPRLGYDEVHHPEWFEPHAGLDEAGKGDLFGPLVCATVIADGDAVRDWLAKGFRDSKTMTDATILKAEKTIRATKGVVAVTSFCGMPKYNQLMARPGANLNKLLAWLHAKALEDALGKRRVPWGLLDQFSKRPLVQNYFKDESFDLQMRTKAESDPVVAAASICARAEFVRQLEKIGRELDVPLPRGAGKPAKQRALALVREHGPEALGEFAKLHFKTCGEVIREAAS